MQVQYSSARRSSSEEKVTLEGSGHDVGRSGVTLDPVRSPALVGVQGSSEDGTGELTCCARFVLKNKVISGHETKREEVALHWSPEKKKEEGN